MKFKEYITEAAKELGSYALRIKDGLTYLYIADDELNEALENYDMENMENKILFIFGIKEDMGMNVMDAIYAQKGFGPIAYKLAMTLEGNLSPVQDSRVTKSAERVWKEFYNGKGAKDVSIEKFGGSEAMMWKRSIYTIKKKINYSKNTKVHDKFIGKDPYQEKITMLDELADGVLINKMSAIY